MVKLKRFLAIGILFGLIGYTFYTQLTKEERVIVPTNSGPYEEIVKNQDIVGSKAIDFTLTNLDGQTVQLSDYKGKKIILNFWATWCPPCKDEMPDMELFYKENGKGVEILAVNLRDRERSNDAIENFIKDIGITFPILLDEKGEVTKAYKVLTIPTSFFIDTKGIIQYHYIGPMTSNDMKRLSDKLD
jgi:peroxiredoxin